MIRELLAMAGIEVAADTVRRFYREVIEASRARPSGQRVVRSVEPQQPRARAAATATRSRGAAVAAAHSPHPRTDPRCRRERHGPAARASPIRATSNHRPLTSMTKQINLVINGKGGVGKSFFAVNFVQT